MMVRMVGRERRQRVSTLITSNRVSYYETTQFDDTV
jgi:hypothetical protein